MAEREHWIIERTAFEFSISVLLYNGCHWSRGGLSQDEEKSKFICLWNWHEAEQHVREGMHQKLQSLK